MNWETVGKLETVVVAGLLVALWCVSATACQIRR
jgi:hypothetical protein